MPLGAGRCNLNLHFGETKITVILLLCVMAGTRSATVICTANPVVLQNMFTEKKKKCCSRLQIALFTCRQYASLPKPVRQSDIGLRYNINLFT